MGSRRALSCKKREFSMTRTLIRGAASRFAPAVVLPCTRALSVTVAQHRPIERQRLDASVNAQVITKLLYLLCQGETFTKVSLVCEH